MCLIRGLEGSRIVVRGTCGRQRPGLSKRKGGIWIPGRALAPPELVSELEASKHQCQAHQKEAASLGTAIQLDERSLAKVFALQEVCSAKTSSES